MTSNPNKIKRLSEQVANQIAAGEVIERPASVVKELMENSIDAGSDQIILKIKRSVNSYLSITDNGCGIGKDDLPLAISQHATSKLVTLQDLQSINSFGFRGEALASVCSAARIKITSKELGEDAAAWSIEIAGDPEQYKIMPASHPVGTTIEVRDLFFNMPVRKRFLKAERTEYQHILEVFQKIALSNFVCGFTLICDERIVYKLPKALTQAAKDNRVKKIFSSSFIDNADYFEGEASGIRIYGWFSHVSYHRSQTDQQYFFLNNRAIRDKLILHALKSVYGEILPEGRHPCYVLYLGLSPSEVDINVHPTKHEVRFCEPRWVHQFIVQQISNVCRKDSHKDSHAESKLDLVSNSNRQQDLKLEKVSEYKAEYNLSKQHTQYIPYTPYTPSTHYISDVQLPALSGIAEIKKIDNFISNPIRNYGSIVADINNSFIITKYKNEYFLVDLNSVYSHLVYLELCSEWRANQKLIAIDSLIFGRVFIDELGLAKDKLLQSLDKILVKLTNFGFIIKLEYNQAHAGMEILDANTGELCNELIIQAIPKACRYSDIKKLFILIFTKFTKFTTSLGLDKDESLEPCLDTGLDKLFMEMSKLALARLDKNLLRVEQDAILDKLAKIDYNYGQFKTPKLAKKLTEDSFVNLMNF